MGTEVAETKDTSTEIAERIEGEDLISSIDSEDLVLPVVQITQQLSRAVTDKKVDSGHFYNSVTGKDYGNEIEFVVVAYQKGRFYVHNRDKPDEQTYVAQGPVAPDTWPEQYAGRPFADIEDAEEQWKERSNAGEIEWGKGPPIVTTHNFVGFVVGDDSPSRLGLSRTSAPAAKKILSALRWSRRSQWTSTYKLSLVEREKGGKPFFRATAEQGRQSEPDEVEFAKELATAISAAGAFALDGTEAEGDEPAKAAKVETPKGGVEV